MTHEELIALDWWRGSMRTATENRRIAVGQVQCARCEASDVDDELVPLRHESGCRWWTTPASRAHCLAEAAYWLDSAGRARRSLQALRSGHVDA